MSIGCDVSDETLMYFCGRCCQGIPAGDTGFFDEFAEGRCLVRKMAHWCRLCRRWFVQEMRQPLKTHRKDPDADTLSPFQPFREATPEEQARAHAVIFRGRGRPCYAYRLVVVE